MHGLVLQAGCNRGRTASRPLIWHGQAVLALALNRNPTLVRALQSESKIEIRIKIKNLPDNPTHRAQFNGGAAPPFRAPALINGAKSRNSRGGLVSAAKRNGCPPMI